MNQLLSRRGASLRARGAAATLVSQFVKATQLLESFDEWELISVPR